MSPSEEAPSLPLWVLVGPTGSGKSALAIEVARASSERGQPVEIISADAMQLYRGMDIGTAKVAVSERGGIPHHLLDVWTPDTPASVEEYQRMARDQILDCHRRGVIPLLVGGSGLYVSAVVYDFDFPGHDPETRQRLEQIFENEGLGPLVSELRQRAPEFAPSIDLDNPRRVIRALEIIDHTGKPPIAGLDARGQWWHKPTRIVGLDADREWLVERINLRVSQMWQVGLVAEVMSVRNGVGFGPTAAQAIGYREVISHLDGELSEHEAKELVAQHTRRYARKQLSWFRRDENIRWLRVPHPDIASQARGIFEGG